MVTLPSAPIALFEEYFDPKAGDFLPIVEIATGKTKKIKAQYFGQTAPSTNYKWTGGFNYAEDAIVEHEGQWFLSLQTPNLGHVPGTTDGAAYWQVQSKAAAGFVFWQAGIYTGEPVLVLYEIGAGDVQIYRLIDAARPYLSSDFEDELANGDWEIISTGGGLSHFKGVFANEAALISAFPSASEGDYALVDTGGTDAALFIWDDTDSAWVASGVASVTPDATDTVKGKVELATPAEAITGTDTERAVTPEALQAKMDAESLAYTPADEQTTVAGLSLENDITVAQLLEALEITNMVPVHADAGTGLTLTNQTNALQVLPAGNTFHYMRMKTTHIRQMRLCARLVTASASANNPRMYIQYSITSGASYVTLGLGTIVSGDAISLFTGAPAIQVTNWIDIPAEAKGDSFIWRVATEGGDGAADPVLGNIYIETKT